MLHVLVADDDHDTVDSLLMLIRLWGYEGVAAYDGAMAVEAVRRHRPDVALLDVAMPRDQDGYALARRLRPEVPLLVAFTGYADLEHQRRCLEVGFDLVLVKPFGAERLSALLGEVERRCATSPPSAAELLVSSS